MEKYYCPITKQIFNEPVVAEDGQIYEKKAIKAWLESNNTSPLTREIIKKDLFPIYQFKDEINEYLKKNPEYKEQQYACLKDYDKLEIINIIKNKTFNKLLKYTDFKLNDIFQIYDDENDAFIKLLLQNCNNDNVIRHVIDNSIDLLYDNSTYVTTNYKLPIHYICKYCNSKLIKYIIENKEINYECTDINGYTPIYYIVKYHCDKDDLINLFIDKKVNLQKTIHYIFKNCSWSIIKNILQKRYSCKTYDNCGMTPIHYLCKRDIMTKNILKYIFNKHININLKTKSGYNSIHLIMLYQKIDVINYLFINYHNYINSYSINIHIKIHDNEEYKSTISLKTLLSINNNLTERQVKKICRNYNNRISKRKKFLSFPINSR